MKYAIFLSFAFLFATTIETPKDPHLILEKHGIVLLKQPEITSLSIAAIKDGKTYKLHLGKLHDGNAPDDDTLYEIASLTKTFTGTLLAKAVAEEKVNIDDDIRLYMDGNFTNLEYEGNPITFRHLLTHTSGLPRMFPIADSLFENPDYDKLPFEIFKLQKNYSKTQFFEALVQVKLDTIPGHKFSYSNAGANLIGYTLENLNQKPFETLLKEYIFKPLDMKSSSIIPSNDTKTYLATGFNHNGIEMPFNPNKAMSAEGGIKSSLGDMVKYMKFHLNTSDTIVRVSHTELHEGKYGDYENGFFWQIFKDGPKPDKIFQNGGAFGTMCWMTLIPETQTGVFIVTNVSGPGVHQKLAETVEAIIDEL
ncbi:serine hydrolase domain-containing protein [Allomuricauda sp. d1]|uniref:serine hydrolase domain-containing protein n=1 Tax=Allomuricauda sp. d1 TaxID=3136725 RepID=UPI0031D54F2E